MEICKLNLLPYKLNPEGYNVKVNGSRKNEIIDINMRTIPICNKFKEYIVVIAVIILTSYGQLFIIDCESLRVIQGIISCMLF